MGAQKDHYTTLGILPTSEDFLVRAAYKALALRYHPDKFTGSKEEANCRMAEINEAYAVLSNPDKRRQYDKARTSKGQPENSYFEDENGDEQSGYDPLKDDWELVLKYYADIIEIESHLSKISRQTSLLL